LAIKERIPGGYVFVDGSRAGDIDYSVMREREALSRDGIVLITLTLETKSGRLLGEPEVITRGFVPPEAPAISSPPPPAHQRHDPTAPKGMCKMRFSKR